jgi:glycosyl transferase family 25
VFETMAEFVLQPCPIIVISLPRSVERRRSIEAQLRSHGLQAEFLEGTDGRAIPESELDSWRPPRPSGYFVTLNPGEVGCYESHRRAGARILERGWPFALVLEDDIRLAPGFRNGLEVLAARAPWAELDLLKLYGRLRGPRLRCALGPGLDLVGYRRPPVSCIATIWTRAGAEKLVAMRPPFRRPIDLKHWWERGLRWACVRPELVQIDSELDRVSTIGGRREFDFASRLRRLGYRVSYAMRAAWKDARRRQPTTSRNGPWNPRLGGSRHGTRPDCGCHADRDGVGWSG